MARATFESVDAYIASRPPGTQNALNKVRSAIRRALPAAQEVISYNMPTYKLHDSAVLHFAGWNRHYSLYGATESVRAAFKNELRDYKIDKGTIQFPFSDAVPEKLIERIAKFRASESID